MSTAIKRKINIENENNNSVKKRWTISYSGRLNRMQFLLGLFLAPLISWAPIFLIWPIVKFIEIIFGIAILDGFVSLLFLGIPFILSVVLGSSVFFRRHHDLNQSGYVFLSIIVVLILIMVINSQLASVLSSFYTLYLLFFGGNKSNNKYGPEKDHKSALQIVGLKK